MADATEERVAQLRRDLAEAERQRGIAENEKSKADSALEAAMGLLQTEFGVKTLEEARALEARLVADLEAETAQVRAALDKAGAAGE